MISTHAFQLDRTNREGVAPNRKRTSNVPLFGMKLLRQGSVCKGQRCEAGDAGGVRETAVITCQKPRAQVG